MDTFFWVLSKIFWAMLSPDTFLFLVFLLGTLLLFTKRRAIGSWLVSGIAVIALVVNIFPIEDMILIPLEDRFPSRLLPERVDGIIVLGGAVNAAITASRTQPTVSESAERLIEFFFLARKYPKAKLVFTGGSGNLDSEFKHSDGAGILFKQMGLDVDRIVFESQSRNTYENAVNSFNLVKPDIGEKWLLITSASHMPRAMGVFRKVKWEVIPYPVDYRTLGSNRYRRNPFGFYRIQGVATAFREWLGLLVYRVSGKTSSLFPGPNP